MEWIKYEWTCIKRAALDAWRSRRAQDIALDVALFFVAGAAISAVQEQPIPQSAYEALVVGGLAVALGLGLIFLFNLMLAPFRIDSDKTSDFRSISSKLEDRVTRLSEEIRVLKEPRDSLEKMAIDEALALLPEDGRLELFRSGAYQNRFDVFGKKMKTETRFGHNGESNIQLLDLDTGGVLERDIGWPYFENNVLVIDGARSGEVIVNGAVQPYTARCDADHGTCYTNLTVGKIKFQIYARSCWEKV